MMMPPLGMLVGDIDFQNILVVMRQGTPAGPYETLAAAKEAGAVTLNLGMFVNALVSFAIVAFAVFLLVKSINRMKRADEAPPPAPTTKECPFCASTIALKATRCPHCTSELQTA